MTESPTPAVPQPTPATATAPEGPSRWRRSLAFALQIVGPFLGLLLVIGVFSLLTDRDKYLSVSNVRQIAIQTAIIGTCGIGMTLIIIGGGIDLSVGSGLALATVSVALVFNGEFYPRLVGTVFHHQTWLAWLAAGVVSAAILLGVYRRRRQWLPAFLWTLAVWILGAGFFYPAGGYTALAAGILMGAACGFVNGLFITTSRVVPFIITLGTMQIYRGAAEMLARGQMVDADANLLETQYPWLYELVSEPETPEWMLEMGPAAAKFLPWLVQAPGVYMMIAAGIAASILLMKTRLGRYFFAIGSNEQAARLSGIDVTSVKLWMYSLAGALMGLAGVMQFSKLTQGDSQAGVSLELDVIAAVVIGGGSLRGGQGSILGTFVGAFLMGFMKNGCNLAGIDTSVQKVLTGTIIIVAVVVDEFRHRRQR